MRGRSVAVASVVVAAASFAPREARAEKDLPTIVPVTIGAFIVADAAFVTIDTVDVAASKRPDHTYGVIEGIVGTPQAAIAAGLNYATTSQMTGDELWQMPFTIAASSVPTFMTVHGLWTASTTVADPGALYGVSWATAADAMLLVADVTTWRNDHFGDRGLALTEMVATAPQIAVASAEVASKTAGSRSGWITLDAVAGALFLHGAIAAIVGPPERAPNPGPTFVPAPGSPTPPYPPAPQPPYPQQPYPQQPYPQQPYPQQPYPAPQQPYPPYRAPYVPPPHAKSLFVPGTTTLAPVAVPGGIGIGLQAVLF